MKKAILNRFLDTPPSEPTPEKFTIINSRRRFFKRFNTRGTTYLVKINTDRVENNPIEYLQQAIEDVLDELLKDTDPGDMVGLTIRNTDNLQDKPVGISMRRSDQISADVVWSVMSKIIQSNARFLINDKITIHVDHVRMPLGNGRSFLKTNGQSVDTVSHLKRSIVEVKAKHQCLIHALIIAIAKVDKDPNYISYRDGYKINQKVLDLIEKSHVNVNLGGGVNELKQLQNYLTDYKIVVYNALRCDAIWFEGQSHSEKRLNLLYDQDTEHFNVIVNLTAAMAVSFVCHGCNNGFRRGENHTCSNSCSSCMSIPPCTSSGGITVYCNDCGRYFRSQTCFNAHKINKVRKKTVCDVRKVCENCNQMIGQNHECFKVYCTVCTKNVLPGHQCYMPTLKKSILSENFMFVFFDIETTQNFQVENTETYIHVPNLLVSQACCNLCIHNDDLRQKCLQCGTREHIFWDDPVTSFIDYLCESRPFINEIICISHYGKGFDSQFILQKCIEKRWTPKLIVDGTKILSMKVEHLHFIDSLNFLPMPLSALPKTFDLNSEKGYYPHFFNTSENLDYVGKIPDKTYFGYDYMQKEGRKQFYTWYETQLNKVYDNKKELEKYCRDDVNVLRKACCKFRELFISVGNVQPFRENITIASACSKVYRRNFLKENRIGIIPSCGYRLADKQSKEAIKWLISEEKKHNINILHAGNGREFRPPELKNIKVDGYHKDTNTIYEYCGCYIHGCTCLANRDKKIVNSDETLSDRYEQTMLRIQTIKEAGYNVKMMWSCEFSNILKNDCKLANELANHPLVVQSPLNFRDAFYGGRTEALKLHYKCKNGEKIRYVDVISLYPWVCKNGKFPIGHPTGVYVGDDCPNVEDLLTMDGFVKCSIIPPTNLYHPVLPSHTASKLMFCLCNTCAMEMNQGECRHTPQQRMLTGTWVLDEVKEACKMGYKISKVHEFIRYEVTQFNGVDGGHFVEYIDTFLKLKTEASGYPCWVKTDDDKQKYIDDYKKAEGILLDVNNIKKNVGLRCLSKLSLNSSWGRLALRPDKTQTKVIKDPSKLFDFLSTPGIEVTNLIFPNDEMVWVSWKCMQEEERINNSVSIAIAAYVTTGARLKLYSYLKDIQTSVLYCDTDSIIYVERDTDTFTVPLGDNLGDLTNEVLDYGPNAYINEFVSGGCKNYAYSILDPDTGKISTVCKVRGISLNFENSKKINFESIKNEILKETDSGERIKVFNPKAIKRKRVAVVVSEPETKTYNIVFNKRRRVDNYDSIPYGYK